MYYKTLRTSETGLKIQSVVDEIGVCLQAQKEIAAKIGFNAWRGRQLYLAGGFYSLLFDKTPDLGIYKEVVKGEYMPKLNTKKGKEIKALLDSCPAIHNQELTKAIGYTEPYIGRPGLSQGNKEYFGFTVPANWDNYIPPVDCEEITSTNYKQLFKV